MKVQFLVCVWACVWGGGDVSGCQCVCERVCGGEDACGCRGVCGEEDVSLCGRVSRCIC